jgi:chaperonin cofactor prefoldin
MIGESNPVFVKIDKYKEILLIAEVINKKLVTVKQLLTELEQLKNKEEEEIRAWEKGMDDITKRLESMQEELIQG